MHVKALGFVGIYVVLLGIATFLEKPALKHLDAVQLNVLVAVGAVVPSVIAVLVHGPVFAKARPSLSGLGIGAVIGAASVFYFLGLRKLPVSVAAPVANTYILVTVLLAVLFLHDRITLVKGLGIALTLVGVTLLAWGA